MSMGHKHTNVKCESEKKVAAIAIWSNRNRHFFLFLRKRYPFSLFAPSFCLDWMMNTRRKRERKYILIACEETHKPDSMLGASLIHFENWTNDIWIFFFNHTHTIYTRTSSIDTMCLCVCVCIECVFFFH